MFAVQVIQGKHVHMLQSDSFVYTVYTVSEKVPLHFAHDDVMTLLNASKFVAER